MTERIPATLTKLAVPIDGLTPYGRNPRHGDVDLIAESLDTHGQYRPIVVRTGTNEVLAGNHTLAAAKQLGWKRIAVTFVDVDDDQAARIVLVDNRAADRAGYDDAALVELLESLPDLAGTGWTDADLADLLAETEPVGGFTDPDDAPEPVAEGEPTISQAGDVWLLGPHRLVVGDSRGPDVWAALLGDGKADAVWTDPPYGVSYVGKTADALTIENDSLDEPGLDALLRDAFGHALANTRPGACWYVAAPAGPLNHLFGAALKDLGVWRQVLIWAKDHFVMGRSDYHYRHEPIFYGWTPGAAHHALVDRTQDSVHEVARPQRSAEHPTMKPVELIERHLANSTVRGELVVDPFGGSGSTLIAAHRLDRRAALIELDPRYADTICRRWHAFTGKAPVLESTGEPVDFDSVSV